jgi:hypothetical protein
LECLLGEPGDSPECPPAGSRAAILLPERMALVYMVCGFPGDHYRRHVGAQQPLLLIGISQPSQCHDRDCAK